MYQRTLHPLALLLNIFFVTSIPIYAQSPKSLTGFNSAQASDEYKLEAQFDHHLKAENLRDWMKKLSAHPHHVGSPYDKENAEYIASLFSTWGFDTQITTSYVLFPTPTYRLLEMVAPTKFIASLQEKPLKEDASSGQSREQLPVYNAYSRNGDVTADLVFVNYGLPGDYEELERHGIDVKGRIVIVKYGASWRGIKPKVAAEKGAIGCIIYSDPKDDGYFRGDVYPQGPYKNEYGAQRGSVADMPLYPGDPLTPGVGATKEAKRLSVEEAPTLTRIPVLPISYGDALPLLKSLAGPMAPEAWRGALPIPYHIGPGPTKVHLKLAFNFDIKPIYNVIAKIEGSEFPDQWILRGNHHDAWVNGANDPVSGLVAELEEARVLGELRKNGWKPKRTIVYCTWDGEEPGLLGSTEWVETNAEELRKKAVVYFNTDGNGRGFLNAAGSHTLEKFFNEVSRDVMDPQTKVSVKDRLKAKLMVNGNPEEQKEVMEQTDLPINALGSGSDYTPFIQHLGIASMNIGYGGEDPGGEYHSIYDSFDHYTRFKDGDFAYGITLAKTTGRCVLRFANADVLPFDFQHFSTTIHRYVTEIKKLLETMRSETAKQNKLIKEGQLVLAADPKETYIPPKLQEPVPYLQFADLENALAKLQKSASAYTEAVNSTTTLADSSKHMLNQLLYAAERLLTDANGLPRRPWYKHVIYAPGFYTGYGVKTLPGAREAIEQRNWKEANEQLQIEATTLEKFAAQIDQLTALWKGSASPAHMH